MFGLTFRVYVILRFLGLACFFLLFGNKGIGFSCLVSYFFLSWLSFPGCDIGLILGAAPISLGGGANPEGILQSDPGRQGSGPVVEKANLQSYRPPWRFCARVLQVAGLSRAARVGSGGGRILPSFYSFFFGGFSCSLTDFKDIKCAFIFLFLTKERWWLIFSRWYYLCILLLCMLALPDPLVCMYWIHYKVWPW